MLIALIVLIVIAGLVAYIHTRPNSFKLERSVLIATSPDKPFALVNDFHEWTKWSPFENVDADLKRTYGGASRGVGATYDWDGKKSGVGHMEILDAPAPHKVVIKLDFIKPFPANNMAIFSFTPTGAGTTATWTMTGPMRLMNKAMTTIMPMEKIVSPIFEQGLASMKVAAER